MEVSLKVDYLPYAVGSSCPYPWLILEENGCYDDDDDLIYQIRIVWIRILLVINIFVKLFSRNK